MSSPLYTVPDAVAENALADADTYRRLYRQSINNPEDFWAEQAKRFVSWSRPWSKVLEWNYAEGLIRWFEGAQLNVCYNCLDRHLDEHGERTAIIWESDEPNVSKTFSYRELHGMVCRFANALKAEGVRKGDRVCIYMPMIVEAVVAMLACARIGAVHSVVFAGFSSQSLRSRILDSDCCIVITADEGIRGGKTIPLKSNVDEALAQCPNVRRVIVVKHVGVEVPFVGNRDVWFHELCAEASTDCPAEAMDAEDPLFILYTSGSTGTPKGVLHTMGGYLLYTAITHKYSFDYHDGEIYWCSADIGWITGHSYIVYGPLANAATTVVFEGVPTYPDASRFWQVVDKHRVNIFYTAPTVIRALMRLGDAPVRKTKRSSLRILATVGEPINPEAWQWYYNTVGDKRCPIVDTWWQTETGGHMITPLPGATALKPGSATRPFFGVCPAIVDDDGHELEGACEGNLVITKPWPGQMRTVYGNHQRFIDTYFSTFPGKYFSGDGCRRDDDGYYWITGRVDDIINVSGHRLGTAEIESALVEHDKVAEAAVVAYPHDIKGQGIYAYVTPMADTVGDDTIKEELCALVRRRIGAIAIPDVVQWAPNLPKTRSGKIMRRILRKIASDDTAELGDTSTLADPSSVKEIIAEKESLKRD